LILVLLLANAAATAQILLQRRWMQVVALSRALHCGGLWHYMRLCLLPTWTWRPCCTRLLTSAFMDALATTAPQHLSLPARCRCSPWMQRLVR